MLNFRNLITHSNHVWMMSVVYIQQPWLSDQVRIANMVGWSDLQPWLSDSRCPLQAWLIHWGWDKMDAISQTTFSNAFFYMKMWISIKISLKLVSKGPINNIPELVKIMAWCRPGDKPLSEPMIVSLLTHICITQPQWVNYLSPEDGW